MAKLVTPNVVPVIQVAPGASRYRLIGLELTVAESVPTLREIVAFGGTQSRVIDTPSDLILDRCYVHGHPTGNLFRGVLLNSAASAVIDSHVSEAHVAGHDSQAILGFNGPGPFKIVNNYLEGAGENIMFGGGDPSIPGLVPSDIEIRGNHLFKPLRWRPDSPDYAGIHWTVKNLFELKNAQRVLVDGNVLENVWVGEQSGASVVLTPRNGGSAPWSVVQDVMFRNNIVRNALAGVTAQSMDNGHPSRSLRRVAIANNLWLTVDRFFLSVTIHRVPVEDLLVDHNTAIQQSDRARRTRSEVPAYRGSDSAVAPRRCHCGQCPGRSRPCHGRPRRSGQGPWDTSGQYVPGCPESTCCGTLRRGDTRLDQSPEAGRHRRKGHRRRFR
jgi:hypothetical protein